MSGVIDDSKDPMKTFGKLVATGLVALPFFASAQTVNAPGGQASTGTPIDQTTTTTPPARGVQDSNAVRYGADGTTTVRPRKSKRPRATADTSKNVEPGVNADTATSHGPNVANTGATTPTGNAPTYPTKKAE